MGELLDCWWHHSEHDKAGDVMTAKKNWIAGAIKKPGGFKDQARRAKKSVAKFADDTLAAGSRASEKTKRRARLARTLRTIADGNKY